MPIQSPSSGCRGALALVFSFPRFYRGDAELLRLLERRKLAACPSCNATGTLNLHGFLLGFSETDDAGKSRRGRRLFCNNRKARHNGCGHTFSLVSATTLRRLRVGAQTLWAFFSLILSLDNTAQALRDAPLGLSLSSGYRLWKRFRDRHNSLRSALVSLGLPPPSPADLSHPAQTLIHLAAAFPSECPIAAFQQQFQVSFF